MCHLITHIFCVCKLSLKFHFMKFLFSLALFLLGCLSFGQNMGIKIARPGANGIEVRGRVLDEAALPLVYAHIILTNIETQKAAKTISGQDGSFILKTNKGEYFLTISMVGLEKITRRITLTANTDLGTIVLKDAPKELDEVEVIAKISRQVTHTATGMVFSVKNDSLLREKSVAQILSYLPGLRVDEQEGSISMIGKNSVDIMLDGKPARLSSSLLFALLESLPGDRLESIEIIQTPSAKYSGRVEGLIDINMKKQRNNGVLGSINARYKTSQLFWPSFFINYKIDKLIFSVGISGMFGDTDVSNYTEYEFLDLGVLYKNQTDNDSELSSKNYRFGLDYELNKKHSFFAGLDLNDKSYENDKRFINQQFNQGSLDSLFTGTSVNDKPSSKKSYDFSYRYDIASKQRLDFAVNRTVMDDDENYLYEVTHANGTGTTSFDSKKRNVRNEENDVWSLQLDYTVPYQKENKLEMGAKYDRVSINNANLFEDFNSGNTVWESDLGLSNSFNYREEVYSGYLSTNANAHRFKYSLGLRLEYILTNSHSPTTDETINNTFTQLLPVVSIKYTLNKAETSSVGFSYRRHYFLPGYLQLNPFESYVNEYTIEKGNPDLEPQITHRLMASFTLRNKYFLSYQGSLSNNSFSQVATSEGEKTVLSFQNVNQNIQHSVSLSIQRLFLFQWWQVYPSARLFYTSYKSDLLESSGSSVSLQLKNNITLPKGISFDTYISWRSNGYGTGIYKTQGGNFYGKASLSKRLFNKRGNVSVNIYDPFNASRGSQSYVYNQIRTLTRSTLPWPQLAFSFSYRFSSGKKVEKKNIKTTGVSEDRF